MSTFIQMKVLCGSVHADINNYLILLIPIINIIRSKKRIRISARSFFYYCSFFCIYIIYFQNIRIPDIPDINDSFCSVE